MNVETQKVTLLVRVGATSATVIMAEGPDGKEVPLLEPTPDWLTKALDFSRLHVVSNAPFEAKDGE